MFAYTPMISGSFAEILKLGFFALFGIYAVNAVIQKYSEGPVGPLAMAGFAAAAVLCFWPLEWLPNLAGAALVLLLIFLSRKTRRPLSPAQPE
jgi:TRAP-type uncharacterized transport system fused permease subunit